MHPSVTKCVFKVTMINLHCFVFALTDSYLWITIAIVLLTISCLHMILNLKVRSKKKNVITCIHPVYRHYLLYFWVVSNKPIYVLKLKLPRVNRYFIFAKNYLVQEAPDHLARPTPTARVDYNTFVADLLLDFFICCSHRHCNTQLSRQCQTNSRNLSWSTPDKSYYRPYKLASFFKINNQNVFCYI